MAPSRKRPSLHGGQPSDTKLPKKKAKEPAGSASGGGSSDDVEENGKNPGGVDGEGSRKELFQRVFSAEDEIAIIKGVAEFTSKTGMDPLRNADAFHDFVKESLRVDATSNQLKAKVRKLKTKFLKKAEREERGGKGLSFLNDHDEKAFELSKKVWGGNAGAQAAEAAAGDGVAVAEKENDGVKAKKGSKKEMRSVDLDDGCRFNAPLALREFVKFRPELGEDAVKERIERIEASKRQELERKWREILDAEFELGVKRAELLAEHARLMLD